MRLSLCLLWFFPLSSLAQVPGLQPKSPLEWGGYLSYLGTATFPLDGNNTQDHSVQLRLNFEYRGTDEFSVNLGMRNLVLFGDSAEIPGYGDFINRDPGYWDMPTNWVNKTGFIVNTHFDRAFAQWTPGRWKLRAGRQRVNWGMSTLWSPNDLFNSYSIYDFDYQERPGTDAVTLAYELGFASSLDLIYGLGESRDESSLAGRYLLNHMGYDFQLLLGKAQSDLVLGAGFAGSINGAGFRGELTHFSPEIDKEKRTAVATLELGYSFGGKKNWMVKGDLLYTSNPQLPENALIYFNRSLTAKTLSFTKWTAYGDLGFDLSPLSRLILASSYYDDGSFYISAINTWSLANDWELLLVLQRFDGRDTSLFGKSAANLISGRLKWSF